MAEERKNPSNDDDALEAKKDGQGNITSPSAIGISSNIELDFNGNVLDLVMVYNNSKYLFAANLNIDLDFVKDLPLVGVKLPNDDDMLSAALWMFITSKDVTLSEINDIEQTLDANPDTLRLPKTTATNGQEVILKKGYVMNVVMMVDGVEKDIILPLSTEESGSGDITEVAVSVGDKGGKEDKSTR